MATVWQQNLSGGGIIDTLAPYLENNFTWAGGVETNAGGHKTFYIDTAKTIGIYMQNYISSTNGYKLGIRFKGNNYQLMDFNTGTVEVEITNTALILSYIPDSNSISATNCYKIIVCDGYNTNTEDNEQILIYLKSLSSSNVSAMYASDVTTPADMVEQNANANVNAKTTNLIPFYNTKSAFITTDVYKSVCEDIAAWYFGNVIVNDKAYRMSGSVFARDI